MSILTKISVVVLLVLVLLACPVFITQATVHPNYRSAYESQIEGKKIAEMALKSEKLAHDSTIVERDKAVEALNGFKLRKQRETDQLTAALAAERARTAELMNDLKTLSTSVTGLDSGVKDLNDRTRLLADQLDVARKEIDALTKENIRLGDLFKQTEAEKDRLDKVAKVGAERIRELEEENEQLRQSGATARTPGQEIAPVGAEGIVGTVTAIRGDIASINIGSANGIKRGMKLIIHRGAQLVGFIRIEEVDIDQAAGIIIDRQLDPMQNDKVTTSLMK